MQRTVLACLGILVGGLVSQECWSKQRAEELVQEALHREVYCLTAERLELLDAAIKAEPKAPQPHWHLGRVRHRGQWLDAMQMPEQLESLRVMQRYHTRRDESPDTIDGHWALAQWCAQQRLPDQQRAHLSRVVTLAPEHVAARAVLGFVRVGSQWVLRADLAAAAAEAQQEQQQLARHAAECRKLAEQLSTGSPDARERAAQRLSERATAEWIPAIETMLANASETAAGFALATISDMPQQRATDSLLRLGLTSRWPDIRHSAAMQLGQRRQDQYVPQLLAALQMPATARTQVSALANGRLVSRLIVHQERMNEHQVAVNDTFFRRINLGGSAAAARAEAADRINRATVERARMLQLANVRTRWTNEQVMSLLASATGQQPGNSAQDWWTWWNDRNEVFVSRKAVRTSQFADEQVIVDEVPGVTGGGRQSGTTVQLPTIGSDCLIAGTPVWTSLGARAVEKVRVGDMVLSQSPDTGELAYKPVLGTTVRPRGPLIHVDFGDEQIACSGGHLFWVSGDGWIKSRLLKSGMPVHTPRGVVRVREVTPQDAAETYNLVVADFHTYFVGQQQRMLCHDNTVREPTDAIVPGLIRQ